MRDKPRALLLDPSNRLADRGLADHLRRVGLEPLRVRDHAEARSARDELRGPITLAFVDRSVDVAWLDFAMMPFAADISARRLVGIGLGEALDRRCRDRIAALGFRHALDWDHDPAELRFVVNRLISLDRAAEAREVPRAPFSARAQLHCDGEAKPARLYTLSVRGAYVSAPAPWPAGREIEIRWNFDEIETLVAARVVRTVTDSTRCAPASPIGMGAVFVDLPREQETRIEGLLEDATSRLAV